ncbi:MAG: asparaginase [Dorea sp.]|nr:asparaginase [Dorea sp.]
MQTKKKILLITTGGTIACIQTENGLAPALTSEELLSFVPEIKEKYEIDTINLFSIDSSNMGPDKWLKIAKTVEENYLYYSGFVICHGTDTMAYTAAALSYLIQNNNKPIVITGAQKPINDYDTDARVNLRDSIRCAADNRLYGVSIVFGGKVIAGTRAKKEYSKSYNAFNSINFPIIASVQDKRKIFFIEGKPAKEPVFYHQMNPNVFILKLIPGMDGHFLNTILEKYDAVIIESFGVGGLPEYEEGGFYEAVKRGVDNGKIIVMATQVTHEGSDLTIYKVGKKAKEDFDLVEAYDLTTEAVVTKTMWALGQTKDPKEFKDLFYKTINHDMLFQES